MATLADRFEAKVDRSGDHHMWTGSKKTDGTGKLKVDGKAVTAHRVAWELAHGALRPGQEVSSCRQVKACVRVEHLSLRGAALAGVEQPRRRSTRGSGSRTQLRPGVWKLTMSAGRYEDGRPRRLHKTVHVDTEDEAVREQLAFAAEVQASQHVRSQAERDMSVNEAIALYLDELDEEKGRERRTLRNYRGVHGRWFATRIGTKRVRDVTEDDIVRVFGEMRRAGLSRSRMQDARNLYAPFFRWAKRRRLVPSNTMADFELPPSTHVAQEHAPPEVEQLCAYLAAAVEVVPDVAPLLTLAAVTGMRRGELVSIRRATGSCRATGC
jgi:integrase